MPTRELDAIDRRILERLQQRGRMTSQELAGLVGLSPSPCLRRLKILEQEGVIRAYIAQLNREKVGLMVTSFVAVKLQSHAESESRAFRHAVQGMQEVTACYITSGEHDFLLQVVAPDLAAYRRFILDQLTKLPQVKDIHSSIVLDTIKEDAPLPLKHLG
jgi:Lrp/AsnC family transcriptional regulator, leucine-responsive regulatory protein